MKLVTMALRALVLIVVTATSYAQAGVSMSGKVGYEVNNSIVTFTVERIDNTIAGTSGSLSLILWATKGSSPVGEGYELAVANLDPLSSDQYYDNISPQAYFSPPPDGSYYLHVVLKEYGRGTVDSLSMGIETFTGSNTDTNNSNNPTSGGSDNQNNQSLDTGISMSGNVSYEVSNSIITLNVGRIDNNTTRTSGTLTLTLWATKQASPSGQGFNLGSVDLGELTSGEYYYNINQQAYFTSPPDGQYYLHVLLEEYGNGIVDYSSFGLETFNSQSSAAEPDSYNPINDGSTNKNTQSNTQNSDISLHGNIGYQVKTGIATLQVGRIENNSSRTSGTLTLSLWATASQNPFTLGRTLASVNLGQLGSNRQFSDVFEQAILPHHQMVVIIYTWF